MGYNEDQIREEKAALRKKAAEKLKTLNRLYLRRSDERILESLLRLPAVQAAQTLFCYVSVEREPDTRRFLETLLAAGKTVAVPRCQGGGLMDGCHIRGFSELVPAPYGLLEPGGEARVIDPASLELVVAPCVAADLQGGRLGHGAGYYDRFLAKTHCPSVCLCRGQLIQDKIPMDDRDRFMDIVLTEEGLFGRGAPV